MGKTIQVAADRAFDQTKTVLPVEVARGVYMTNAPSLAALKLMHLMIATAGGKMADDMRHEIRLADIRKIEGMDNHTRASLTPLFGELAAAVLTSDDPEKKIITIGGFLDEARIDYRNEASGELLLTWNFRSTFRRMASDSNHWAIVDRQTVFHLSSKYAVLVFQHISSLEPYTHLTKKTFTVHELRALLGLAEGKLARFADLNKWALKPAISEINHLSRLSLIATSNKVGRSVVSVTISWQVKPDPDETKRELIGHNSGRKGSEKGTIEAIVLPFPEAGGITYSPHWIELKLRAGCNKDNDLIASDFRRFCRERSISLNAHDIDKKFSSYCAKVGKV